MTYKAVELIVCGTACIMLLSLSFVPSYVFVLLKAIRFREEALINTCPITKAELFKHSGKACKPEGAICKLGAVQLEAIGLSRISAQLDWQHN